MRLYSKEKDESPSTEIRSTSIYATNLRNSIIEADKIAANAVTATKINADTIVADHIYANSITTVKINDLAVTNAKIGNGNAMQAIVSDVLQHSNDTSPTTTSATYVKLKEIKLATSLENCRVRFYLEKADGVQATGRVYKNGAAIGIERQTISFTTYSEDFTDFDVGDLIQIYAHSDAGGETTRVSALRFYYSAGYADDTNQDS